MPPKKNPKKTKKTTKKIHERIAAGDNDLEAKYRRGVLDIAILQDHIALQCESVRMVRSDRIDLRRRLRDMEQKLEHERQDYRDVNSDLTRQYKTMQAELTNKVKRLETEVSQLNEELALCQEVQRRDKREREQTEQEKDATIADLRHKLDNVEIDHEKILQLIQLKDTPDSLTCQLSVARQAREDKSPSLRENDKGLLSELDI